MVQNPVKLFRFYDRNPAKVLSQTSFGPSREINQKGDTSNLITQLGQASFVECR